MANRIPRNAALFHITLLQDTGSNKAGTKATVYRHVYDGWQMLTESGERFMVLTSYLRMSEVVQIDDFMLFPEEITEAQFQDVKKITAKHYSRLYNADDIETDNESMIYSSLFDWYLSKHAEAVRKYNAHCFDFLTSDREGAAFMLALYELQNAHTETEITEGKEDTTTTETEPQRATETAQKTAVDTTTAGSDTDRTEAAQAAEKTIRTGARLYSHPHRHMVTVEGLHEGLVMVIYHGRLYLVSRGDLYTDETETTPAILPAEEAAQPAAVIPMENATTSATQEATESATATTGRECTQEAAQDAQNANRATKAHRPIQRHTAPHKRPYRDTQRAAKSIMRHSPTTATGRRTAEKSHFLAGMGSAKILGQDNHPPPILTHFFDRFLKRFLSGQKSTTPGGIKNLLQILERKIFKKILKGR